MDLLLLRLSDVNNKKPFFFNKRIDRFHRYLCMFAVLRPTFYVRMFLLYGLRLFIFVRPMLILSTVSMFTRLMHTQG